MSSRYKKLLENTEDLPLYDKESEDNKFPKYAKFVDNTVKNLKREQGQNLLEHPEINEDFVNKSEDIPEPLKALLKGAPDLQNQYRQERAFAQRGGPLDRTEIDEEVMKAILEQKNPVDANNLKYNKVNNPWYKEYLTKLAGQTLDRDIPAFEFAGLPNAHGLYQYENKDPRNGDLYLNQNYQRRTASTPHAIGVLAHEINHKEVDNPNEYSEQIGKFDFTKSNRPDVPLENIANYHNKVVAPKTEASMASQEADSYERNTLDKKGQQYNAFERLLDFVERKK